jgi:hypothetical protein
MPIDLEGDYLFMIRQAVKMKTPMVSITIDEDEDESDKENNEGSDEEKNKKQRKKVSIQPVLSYRSFCSCIITIEWQTNCEYMW